MSFNVTNQVAAPALRGEDALVVMSWSDSSNNIAKIFIGEAAGCVSSGKLGTVSEIDPSGLIVKIKPAQPDRSFDSLSTPGILNAGELITFF